MFKKTKVDPIKEGVRRILLNMGILEEELPEMPDVVEDFYSAIKKKKEPLKFLTILEYNSFFFTEKDILSDKNVCKCLEELLKASEIKRTEPGKIIVSVDDSCAEFHRNYYEKPEDLFRNYAEVTGIMNLSFLVQQDGQRQVVAVYHVIGDYCIVSVIPTRELTNMREKSKHGCWSVFLTLPPAW